MDTTGPGGDLLSLIRSYKIIIDPDEREAFKNSRPGLRRGDAGKTSIDLTPVVEDEALIEQYRRRRTHRQFSLTPVAFAQFSRLLSCLRPITLDGKPKYLYASPGALNPGQVYLHCKPGRVENVPAGTYYYHPIDHKLVCLTPGAKVDSSIHIPFINAPIFDEAAFSLFFICPLSAIGPSYGERSIHFATLEAGIMAHLLEASAPECEIGLCQIGSIDFEPIRPLFELQPDHVLLHSMVGGRIDSQPSDGGGNGGLGDPAARLRARIQNLSPEEARVLLEATKRDYAKGKDE
jgi:SagB-type dehydrogenase family enzyme